MRTCSRWAEWNRGGDPEKGQNKKSDLRESHPHLNLQTPLIKNQESSLAIRRDKRLFGGERNQPNFSLTTPNLQALKVSLQWKPTRVPLIRGPKGRSLVGSLQGIHDKDLTNSWMISIREGKKALSNQKERKRSLRGWPSTLNSWSLKSPSELRSKTGKLKQQRKDSCISTWLALAPTNGTFQSSTTTRKRKLGRFCKSLVIVNMY